MTWFWPLLGGGLFIFLTLAGISLTIRAERSGGPKKPKDPFKGTALDQKNDLNMWTAYEAMAPRKAPTKKKVTKKK